MNTAIAITAIIAATIVINVIVYAIRDVAQTKHKTTTCDGCNNSEENEA